MSTSIEVQLANTYCTQPTMNPHGFLRVSAACTSTSVANPRANRIRIEKAIQALPDSDVIVFGELCLSGYTCGELFAQRVLLDSCIEELIALAQSIQTKQLVVVGLPYALSGRLFNVAAVLCEGKILGLIPKQHLPTYQEFYESRWFQSGAVELPKEIELSMSSSSVGVDSFYRTSISVPFGTDLLFTCGEATVGIEICEDLWVPIPPSSLQALAGANVLLNLSASNETVGKASYRKKLVAMHSGKCIAAYAYASAGPSESTTDLVFGGHCLVAENGSILAESKRIGTGLSIKEDPQANSAQSVATTDIDLGRLAHDRQVTGTVHQPLSREFHRVFRQIPFELNRLDDPEASQRLLRYVDGHPFVPSESAELKERCDEIFEIQCAAIAKRVYQLPKNVPLVLGVSGGLDSTLALIVTAQMMEATGINKDRFIGLTMPGFGTSQQTKNNASELTRLLGLKLETIDIREQCLKVFHDLNHAPLGISLHGKTVESLQSELERLPDERRHDLVFENVQARVRTLLLMNKGFVIGTGDLSEAALGWSTYNADHMSMYNVNCSVPKTLVKFLVKHVALTRYTGDTQRVLLDIVDTPISPELLPLSENKTLHQSTEAAIGPYELHDFFLYHFVRGGAAPDKMLLLARNAKFDNPHTDEQLKHALNIFIRRFFAAQFKRTCVPDGPKVGTVSLSPRGDWRMPSDADPAIWLDQ